MAELVSKGYRSEDSARAYVRGVLRMVVACFLLSTLCGTCAFSALKPELVPQLGWPEECRAQAWADHGRSFVTIANSVDGLAIWDPKTWRVLRHRLIRAGGELVALSPNGKYVAVASGGKPVGVILASTGREVCRLAGVMSSGCFFSADSTLLVDAQKGYARLWRIPTGKLVRTILTPGLEEGDIVRMSPDGSLLLVVGERAALWNTRSGKLLHVLKNDGKIIGPVAFSPDSKLLATSADQPGWRTPTEFEAGSPEAQEWEVARTFSRVMWDARTGRRIWSKPDYFGPSPPTNSLLLFDKGRKLLTTTEGWHMEDATTKVWNVSNGKVIRKLPGSVNVEDPLAISPDGSMLAAGPSRYSLPRFSHLHTIPSRDTGSQAMSVSPDGQKLAVVRQESITVWSLDRVAAARIFAGGDWPCCDSFFLQDPKALVVPGYFDFDMWNAETGGRLKSPIPPRKDGEKPQSFLLSPNGRLLLSMSESEDGVLHVTDVPTGAETHAIGPHVRDFSEGVFSPDSRLFVAEGYDAPSIRHTFIYDLAGGESRELKGFEEPQAFSPDSRTLAELTCPCDSDDCSEAALWQLWDLPEGRVRASFAAGRKPHSLAFSPDGRLVATSQDSGVQIHRATDGVLVRYLESSGPVGDIRFHPNGRLVIGGGFARGRVQFWDVSTGRRVLTLISEGPNEKGKGGFWIAYTPDGYYNGSKGIEVRINWRVGQKLLPGRVSAGRFRRPAIVSSVIGL
ncbi:MAG: WD40 repeat domain-containing protein [Armatimonadota bacterium]|nr:WD40 repeat domain-containing protein [Armatimonadota bacterium]